LSLCAFILMPRDAMHKRGLYAVRRCPSVCLSATFVYSVETNKHYVIIFKFKKKTLCQIFKFRCRPEGIVSREHRRCWQLFFRHQYYLQIFSASDSDTILVFQSMSVWIMDLYSAESWNISTALCVLSGIDEADSSSAIVWSCRAPGRGDCPVASSRPSNLRQRRPDDRKCWAGITWWCRVADRNWRRLGMSETGVRDLMAIFRRIPPNRCNK